MTGAMMLPSSLPLVRFFAAPAAAKRGPAGPRPRSWPPTSRSGPDSRCSPRATPGCTAGRALVLARRTALAHRRHRPGPRRRVPVQSAEGTLPRCLPHPAELPLALLPAGRRRRLEARRAARALLPWLLLGADAVMFAVGVGSLVWMAGLTGVMVIEKTARQGRRLAPIVGAALMVWGAPGPPSARVGCRRR